MKLERAAPAARAAAAPRGSGLALAWQAARGPVAGR